MPFELKSNQALFKYYLSKTEVVLFSFFQIISVDESNALQNVPDELVKFIPLFLLTSLTSVNVSLINEKSWSHEQVTTQSSMSTLSAINDLLMVVLTAFSRFTQ